MFKEHNTDVVFSVWSEEKIEQTGDRHIQGFPSGHAR
jgi:hypothetical protein